MTTFQKFLHDWRSHNMTLTQHGNRTWSDKSLAASSGFTHQVTEQSRCPVCRFDLAPGTCAISRHGHIFDTWNCLIVWEEKQADEYIAAIRNPRKKQYAKDYRAYLASDPNTTNPPAENGLSLMAAQCVRLRLTKTLKGSL